MSKPGNLLIFDEDQVASGPANDGSSPIASAVGGESSNNTWQHRETLGSSIHKTNTVLSKTQYTSGQIDLISGSDEGSDNKLAATFDSLEAGIVIHFFEDELKKIDCDYGGLTSRQPSTGQVQQVEIRCGASKDPRQIKSCVDEIKQKIKNVYATDSVTYNDKYLQAKEFVESNRGNRKVLYYLTEKDGNVHIAGPVYQDVKSGKHQLNVHLGFTKTTGQRSRSYAGVVATGQESTKSDGPNVHHDLSQETRKKSSFSSSYSSRRHGEFDFTEELRGGMVLRVYKASIVKLNVDVIVNAANDILAHGGGVARAIADAAGYSLTQESKEYIDRHQRIPVTKNCVTTAGKLKYQGVIHAVGPQWYMYRDKLECVKDVYYTVLNIFETCEDRGYSTVAIPAISAGIYAVPKTLCTDMYVKATVDFSSKNNKSLREIHFVDVDEEILKLIKRSYEKWKEDPKSIDPKLIVSKYLTINPSPEPWGGQGQGHNGGRGYRGQRRFVSDNGNDNRENEDRWKGNNPGQASSWDNKGNNPGHVSSWDDTGQNRSICKVTNGPNVMIGQGIIADTYKINDQVIVKIYNGSIEKVSTVRAVVSSADKDLKPNGFIANALEKAGGNLYASAVKKMRKDNYQNTKQTGDVAVSDGGDLKVRNVIHLVSKRVNSWGDISMFKTGMANVLTEADTNRFNSIALPLLGTGGLKHTDKTFSDSCTAFVQTICEFYANNPDPTLKEIHLVNHSDKVSKGLNKAFGTEARKPPQTSMQHRPLPEPPSNNSASSPMDVDNNEDDLLYDTIGSANSSQKSGNSQWNRREPKPEFSDDVDSDEDKNGGYDRPSKTSEVKAKEPKGNLVILD